MRASFIFFENATFLPNKSGIIDWLISSGLKQGGFRFGIQTASQILADGEGNPKLMLLENGEEMEIYQALSKAGCASVYIGVENLSPEFLKGWHKNGKKNPLEIFRRITGALHEQKIGVTQSFILTPDMEPENMENQMRMVSQVIKPDEIFIEAEKSFPGSMQLNLEEQYAELRERHGLEGSRAGAEEAVAGFYRTGKTGFLKVEGGRIDTIALTDETAAKLPNPEDIGCLIGSPTNPINIGNNVDEVVAKIADIYDAAVMALKENGYVQLGAGHYIKETLEWKNG